MADLKAIGERMKEIVKEQPIIREGEIIGYRQYVKGFYSLFGLSFRGYRWLE